MTDIPVPTLDQITGHTVMSKMRSLANEFVTFANAVTSEVEEMSKIKLIDIEYSINNPATSAVLTNIQEGDILFIEPITGTTTTYTLAGYTFVFLVTSSYLECCNKIHVLGTENYVYKVIITKSNGIYTMGVMKMNDSGSYENNTIVQIRGKILRSVE